MTEETTNGTDGFDAGNIAEIFHTALRKGVDGPASVASWNMLHFLPEEVRVSFYDHLKDRLHGTTFDAGSLRRAALSWGDTWSRREHHGEVCAFAAVLSLHPLEDWSSIAQFARSCGLAPEASWNSDDLSLWTEGRGFETALVGTDAEDRTIARATRRTRRAEEGQIRCWNVKVPGLDPIVVDGGDEAIVEVATKMREAVKTARLERLEAAVRPEVVESYRGIDLAPALDPASEPDRRLLALAGSDPIVLWRRPRRDDGVASVEYVFGVRDPESRTGWRFSTAFLRDGAEETKAHRSSIGYWLDGSRRRGDAVAMGMDDDMVRGTLHLSHRDDVLTVRAVVEKVGRGAGILAETASTVEGVVRIDPGSLDPRSVRIDEVVMGL